MPVKLTARLEDALCAECRRCITITDNNSIQGVNQYYKWIKDTYGCSLEWSKDDSFEVVFVFDDEQQEVFFKLKFL